MTDTDKTPFGSLLGDMKDLTDRLKEEEARTEEERILREAEEGKNSALALSKKILPRKSKKPITEAILRATTPDEIAGLVVKFAKAGREWAMRLVVQYIQTPETLNRLAGEGDGEPIRIESLMETARSLGVDMDAVAREAESRLRGEWVAGDVVGSSTEPSTDGVIVNPDRQIDKSLDG